MLSIEVKNLAKKFNDFTAVDNISFTLRKASISAFLGPNGAGKTTTIKMLTTQISRFLVLLQQLRLRLEAIVKSARVPGFSSQDESRERRIVL